MKTVTLTNQKGGVSKTTTALVLAQGLSHRMKNVLVVDLDPQGNLTASIGGDLTHETLYSVFKGACKVSDALQHVADRIDLLSVGLAATGADMELAGHVAREYMLKNALETLQRDYDVCVIDTPPMLGLLTLNALTATDTIIIPLILDAYSLQGISQLAGLIENVRTYTNKGLEISGLLVTKIKPNLNISKSLGPVVVEASKTLNTSIYNASIPEAIAIREAQLAKEDIFIYAKGSKVAASYESFVDEFINKEGI